MVLSSNSMSNTATGKLHLKKQTQVISDKFQKQEFVIVTQDKFPQFISFQLTGDKCGQVDNYQVGQDINVHYNLRGREWQAPSGEVKYFNTIEAWKIEPAQPQEVTKYERQPEPIGPVPTHEQSDLPF